MPCTVETSSSARFRYRLWTKRQGTTKYTMRIKQQKQTNAARPPGTLEDFAMAAIDPNVNMATSPAQMRVAGVPTSPSELAPSVKLPSTILPEWLDEFSSSGRFSCTKTMAPATTTAGTVKATSGCCGPATTITSTSPTLTSVSALYSQRPYAGRTLAYYQLYGHLSCGTGCQHDEIPTICTEHYRFQLINKAVGSRLAP